MIVTADGVLAAVVTKGNGVADVVLVDGRNHERIPPLDAMIYRVIMLRLDGELNRFKCEE